MLMIISEQANIWLNDHLISNFLVAMIHHKRKKINYKLLVKIS